MVSTPKPNGFADHYPYEKWLFHWEYTLFSDKPTYQSPNDSLKKPRLITQNYIWIYLVGGFNMSNIRRKNCAEPLPHITDYHRPYVWYMFYLCAECIFFYVGFKPETSGFVPIPRLFFNEKTLPCLRVLMLMVYEYYPLVMTNIAIENGHL